MDIDKMIGELKDGLAHLNAANREIQRGISERELQINKLRESSADNAKKRAQIQEAIANLEKVIPAVRT